MDFACARLSVRRWITVVKHKGEGEEIVIGLPKGGRSRTVNLDPGRLAALKAHRSSQGTLSQGVAPERFSRRFVNAVVATRRVEGEEKLSRIRLHDVRHTQATLLLAAGIPVKVVSERLGHASSMITLATYAHVMAGMQAEAAAKLLMSSGTS